MRDISLDDFITFQERVFLSYVLGPAKRIVNTTGVWKLTGPIDENALRVALDVATKRNAAMRIYYEESDAVTPESVERAAKYPGEPNYKRHIAPQVTPVLKIESIADLPLAERQERIHKFRENQNTTPIDLMKAPLFYCSLLHAGDETHYIALTLFHPLADGLSFDALLKDMSEAYNAALDGRAVDVAQKEPNLNDMLGWLRDQTRNPDVKRQTIDYWADYVRGFSDLRLKADFEVGESEALTLKALRNFFDFRLPVSLQTFEAGHGALAQGLAYAPYALMISTFAPGQTILSCNTMSGRFVPDYEGIVGYWMAMRLAKAEIDEKQSALDFVLGLQKDFVAAQKHSTVDFNSILAAMLGKSLIPADFFKRRSASHVMFNVTGVDGPAPTFTFRDTMCEEVTTSEGQTLPCHINCEVRIDGDHVTGVIACWAQLFSPATGARMAALYEAILKAIVSNPQASVGDILKLAQRAN